MKTDDDLRDIYTKGTELARSEGDHDEQLRGLRGVFEAGRVDSTFEIAQRIQESQAETAALLSRDSATPAEIREELEKQHEETARALALAEKWRLVALDREDYIRGLVS